MIFFPKERHLKKRILTRKKKRTKKARKVKRKKMILISIPPKSKVVKMHKNVSNNEKASQLSLAFCDSYEDHFVLSRRFAH